MVRTDVNTVPEEVTKALLVAFLWVACVLHILQKWGKNPQNRQKEPAVSFAELQNRHCLLLEKTSTHQIICLFV